VEGDLSQPDDQERTLLGDIQGERYACMAEALGDVIIQPLRAWDGAQIQIEGVQAPFSLEPWGEGYGLAVDIGTTTVAAYLYRLADGACLAAQSALNPQARFGADVISRIQAALSGQGEILAQTIWQCIKELRNALTDSIQATVITGNTAMLYLLCGYAPHALAAMPFRADHLFGEWYDGCMGRVYLPACIAAYVGADITAALLAADLYRDGTVTDGPPRLLVDIGTNGEIALAANGRLLCCATAAGPAFEGAGISCGMLAKPGAIDRVDYSNGTIRFTVIGEGEALGLCGSGLVDAAAALLEAGLLDETGVLQTYTFPGTTVSLTQADIRALQLAKAAICAGMKTLLAESGVTEEEVAELLIAGGFGSRIRPDSAERIGLIPRGLAAKARAIGNAAGMGAGMILLNQSIRDASERVAQTAQVLELSTDPRFMDAYIEGMMFERMS